MVEKTEIVSGTSPRSFPEIESEIQSIWPGFHHKVLGDLGEGGCGRLVKIRWNVSGEMALLKYPLSAEAREDDPDPLYKELRHSQWCRFLKQEAQVLYAFRNYEAAIKVLDLHASDQAFLMEWVPFGKLLDHLGKTKFTWREKLAKMLPILELLTALQREAVYHRDLSLDNIFVASGFRLKLGDFGLVHRRNQPIVDSILGGKPGYVHPRHGELKRAGEPSRNDIQDVYSFCICLLGWVLEEDPNGRTNPRWFEKAPPALLQPLLPILLPEGSLPPWDEGIACFDKLQNRLRALLAEEAADGRANPARAATTGLTFPLPGARLSRRRPPTPKLELEVPDGWRRAEDDSFGYAFLGLACVRRFEQEDPAWPRQGGFRAAPFDGDPRLAAMLTWRQADYLARVFHMKLPGLQQARRLRLPETSQIWTGDCLSRDLAYVVDAPPQNPDRFEHMAAAAPTRLVCLIRDDRESEDSLG